MASFRAYVEQLTAGIQWLRNEFGAKFSGTIGLLADMVSEGTNQAIKARFVTSDTCPNDALPYIGGNVDIERFVVDTDDTYKARLARSFELNSQHGTRQILLFMLSEAGWPLAQVLEDEVFKALPQPWWSQFVIYFPEGSHSVQIGTAVYGDGTTYGDGTLYGMKGITAERLSEIKRLVLKWKRPASICRYILFVIDGNVYGDGSHYGDPGLVYGGVSLQINVQ